MLAIEAIKNTVGDKLANTPAGHDEDLQVGTESHGSDLGGVSWAHGRKHTPRQTAENLAGKQDLNAGRKEDDKYRACQPSDGTEQNLLVAEAFSEDTVEEDADNTTKRV